MRRNALQLSRRHKAALYAVTLIVFVSGAAWAYLHTFARHESEFGPQFSPAEPWLIKAHGAAAMGVLVAIGTLLPIHVKRGWQAGKNRLTGVGLLTIFFLLTLTGYGLYYSGGEDLRALTSLVHIWIGLALPAILGWHVIYGHRLRRMGKLRRSDEPHVLP